MSDSIGKRLRNLRYRKGVSLTQAASDIGISKSALSMYENDERVPRDGVKVCIARYYGVSIESTFYKNISF